MTRLNDLQERVAGYVLTCPDEDLLKLDIAALAKIVNANPRNITRAFKQNMRITFETYLTRIIAQRIYEFIKKEPGISTKELLKRFACKRIKKLNDIFESYLFIKPAEYIAIVRNRENRSFEVNREEIDVKSGRSGDDELRGVFTQPAIFFHQN